MTSKKAPSLKRAVLPRTADRTKVFVKDWTRLSHSGRYDMRRLKDVMLAETLNMSREYVGGRLVKRSNFPRPALVLLQKIKRWDRDAVNA